MLNYGATICDATRNANALCLPNSACTWGLASRAKEPSGCTRNAGSQSSLEKLPEAQMSRFATLCPTLNLGRRHREAEKRLLIGVRGPTPGFHRELINLIYLCTPQIRISAFSWKIFVKEVFRGSLMLKSFPTTRRNFLE